MADFLSITTCAATTESMLLLSLLAAISLTLIGVGVFARIGFLGFFGAVSLMAFAWHLSPCQPLIGFIVGSFSIVMIIWFAISFIGFNNEAFSNKF